MLLSTLLAAPHLGLRLLHQGPGGLERPVGRPLITDLLTPGRYLTGGELVLTGLVWRREPEDSVTFVESIAERGVTVLVAGTAQFGQVPEDLVDACREAGVTVLELATEVPFADITEHLAAAQSAADGARLSATLGRQRQLLHTLASGGSLDELAARVSEEIGHTCRVLTPVGRHVVAGPADLPAASVDAVTRAFLSADRLPTVTGDGASTHTLVPVGSALGDRLTSWLVVAEGDHRTWPPEDLDAVQELAAISALDRARREEGTRSLRPVASDLLALVRSGAPESELAPRLRQTGLDPDRPLVVVSAAVDGGRPEVAAAVLEDVARVVGPPVVAPGPGGEAVAFLSGSDEVPDLVRSCVHRLRPGAGRLRLDVGVSGLTSSDSLQGALEEARFARRAAASGTGPVSVVGATEVASHVLLLATVPDEVRRTYAHRVLGALLAHDEQSRGDLVDTLRRFLACSGSWSRTAESMHLHVNTVRYRIEKVQELTGRDLSTLEDRVDVFLALKSL